MRKSVLLLMAFTVIFAISSVSAQTSNKRKKVMFPAKEKILIVYFSRTGNTREMASQIQKATGGDIFEIVPLKPYPAAYQEVVDQAKKEINSGFKPALKTKVKDISKYDVIFVGSPNWWSTIAPPVATFLTNYDLSGKTIVPFMTHGGGGMARCEKDVQKLCPKSNFAEGLALNGHWVKKSKDEVNEWLRKIKIIK